MAISLLYTLLFLYQPIHVSHRQQTWQVGPKMNIKKMVTQHPLSGLVRRYCETKPNMPANLQQNIQRPGPFVGENISSSCL